MYHSNESSRSSDVEDLQRRNVKKKGLCYRCHKGNRFTEKEVCIVCGAAYCKNCVLKAMGSMPQGRKCITCIGFGINESKRSSLGKCSKMLKRLLTKFEVERIMSSEVDCKANQIPSHLVCVNGKSLSHNELFRLQSCKYPPKKLKPGNYWYDKLSGFWGKEGEIARQIISPQLPIGGPLRRDASNGNTNVFLNGREVNKQEILLLKFAGICTEGRPSYWLSPDGSYQEEGQKNVMGQKWDNIAFKLLCAAMSLPVPPESYSPSTEVVDDDGNNIKSKNLNQAVHYKLLLVGCDQSGTSTLFKQTKFIYNVPFSEDERRAIKLMIQRNLYSYVAAIMLEWLGTFEQDDLIEMGHHIEQHSPSEMSEQFGEENIYSISPRLKALTDWLLQEENMSGNLEDNFPATAPEYEALINEFWKDKAFQAAYNQKSELHTLPKAANYFLDRAIEISRAEYEPSESDILYADGFSSLSGIASVEFSLRAESSYIESVDDQDDSLRRYELIRVPARSIGKNGKWLEMFEDVELVLYCVSLTDYAEVVYKEDIIDGGVVYTNKMLASKNLFERIITHSRFTQKTFLLVLNKFDLLEEMIDKTPLTECVWFDDFNPVEAHYLTRKDGKRSRSSSPAERAFHYIAAKFKGLFKSLTGRNLYVSSVTGLDSDSVDKVLKYANEILKWEEEKSTFSVNQWSSWSIDPSSIS